MIVSWLKKGALLLSLIATEGSKLSADQSPLPKKDEISLTKGFAGTEQSLANSNRALIGLKENRGPAMVAYEGGFLSGYKTDPSIIDCPKRNLTKKDLQKEVKDESFIYRWYRNGMFHLSNADQIKHAYNHCNMSLEDYRKLFVRYEHDKNETFLGKVCRAYIPPDPKGKPMYVLILGHTEKLNDSPNDTGIIDIYDKLVREKRGIVLMFMTGSVLDEVDNALALKCRFTEYKVLFAHMERNIGDFVKEYNPSKLGFLGYSKGGGAIVQLSKNPWCLGNTPVKSVVSMDAINPNAGDLGSACRTRPNFGNAPYTTIYQYEGGIHPFRIQGNYPQKIKYCRGVPVDFERDWREGDVHRRIPNTNHTRLHNLSEVKESAYQALLRD